MSRIFTLAPLTVGGTRRGGVVTSRWGGLSGCPLGLKVVQHLVTAFHVAGGGLVPAELRWESSLSPWPPLTPPRWGGEEHSTLVGRGRNPF